MEKTYKFHLSPFERVNLLDFWNQAVNSKDRLARRQMKQLFNEINLNAIEHASRFGIPLNAAFDARDEFEVTAATVDYMLECLDLPLIGCKRATVHTIAGDTADRLIELKNGTYKAPEKNAETTPASPTTDQPVS